VKKQVEPQKPCGILLFYLFAPMLHLLFIIYSCFNTKPYIHAFQTSFLSQNAQTIKQPPYQVSLALQSIHIRHGVFLVVRGLVVIEANHDGHFKLKNIN
jgi:hypothetical protein